MIKIKLNKKEIERLIKDPIQYAMLMEEDELEHVIVLFVSVFLNRKTKQGGKYL